MHSHYKLALEMCLIGTPDQKHKAWSEKQKQSFQHHKLRVNGFLRSFKGITVYITFTIGYLKYKIIMTPEKVPNIWNVRDPDSLGLSEREKGWGRGRGRGKGGRKNPQKQNHIF